MQLAFSHDRLSSRMSVDPSALGEPEVESSVIEWLLHDDPRFGECMLVQRHPFVRFYAAIALRAPNGEIVGASLTRICESSRPAHRDGFASADRALYHSKHGGRNQVTMA